MFDQAIIEEIEHLVGNGKIIQALELAIKKTPGKRYFKRNRLLTLKSELERQKKRLVLGYISEEEYSTRVNRATSFLLNSIKEKKSRFSLIPVASIVLAITLTLFLIPYFIQSKALVVSPPRVEDTKISFLIHNEQEERSNILFVFQLPAEYSNSLMPTSYVNLIKNRVDTIDIEIIEESISDYEEDPVSILEEMKNNKENSFELIKMGKGIYQADFFTRETVSTQKDELWRFLQIYCSQNNNLDFSCKEKSSFIHQLQLASKRPFLLFLIIFCLTIIGIQNFNPTRKLI